MAALSAFASFAGSLLLTPFLMFMLCVIFLASIGKSLGVRRLYVSLLLRIFEYGRINIEVAKQRGRSYSSDGVSDLIDDYNDDADECAAEEGKQKSVPYETLSDSGSDGSSPNVNANSDNILISREAPIMVPNAVGETNSSIDNLNHEKGQGQPEIEFHLSDCLEYIKSGMESIIEDQVTSRFETEELKNWNLLTRTNRHYEFISWRLTVIWVLGFFVRYCFLLPLRVLICFVGVMWMILAFLIISFFPRGMLKRWLNDHAFKITFRILSRSLSTVLTFHNTEFRPKKGGFCVANHTTPIDVVILSTENSFSLVMWLTVCTALVGYMPEGPAKRWMVRKVSIMCFGVLSAALSSVITYHNLENRPLTGICVANHTSPIDVLVLMCDNCYSLIGQRHGGFLGILQRALARASPHIWFERSEVKDRSAVASRLRQHVSDPKNPPILIFPEGTCINNTSVMQFKKGSFEVGGVIYPVAIKYDPKFGDAFWNSSRYSMLQYLYMMMSSWAIVCDVWYLPPMYQQEGESAIDFANRVKSVIARQGGLVDLVWDGQLKRMKPKKEWREKQQEIFSKWLKGGVPTTAED